jgi:SAM-dependent methyltransferase
MSVAIALARLDSLETPLSLDEIEAETIAAYDLLAPEYDSLAHTTTRILERLSLDLFAEVVGNTSVVFEARRVLEVGCGTGILSRLLVSLTDENAEVVLLDSSASMLHIAHDRLKGLEETRVVRYTHASILTNGACCAQGPFDLVVCGLGDPYFVDRAVVNMWQYCGNAAFLIVTLPHHSWAEAERIYRLGIPSNRTRFRLSSGVSVYPFSFTYSEDGLRRLLLRCGFETIGIWSQFAVSETEPSQNGPSGVLGITCALARVIRA